MYYVFAQPLSWFLDLGFNDFIGLKNTPVAVGPHGPMLSSDVTPQKEPGPNKIIPPTDHMWLGIRKGPRTIVKMLVLGASNQ